VHPPERPGRFGTRHQVIATSMVGAGTTGLVVRYEEGHSGGVGDAGGIAGV